MPAAVGELGGVRDADVLHAVDEFARVPHEGDEVFLPHRVCVDLDLHRPLPGQAVGERGGIVADVGAGATEEVDAVPTCGICEATGAEVAVGVEPLADVVGGPVQEVHAELLPVVGSIDEVPAKGVEVAAEAVAGGAEQEGSWWSG